MKPVSSRRKDDIHKQATKAMVAKDWQKAAHLWAELRKAHPRVVASYDQAARALMHLDRGDEAEALLVEGMRRFPRNAVIAMRHAVLPESRKDWAQAVTRWRHFHANFQGTAHSVLQYGKVLIHAGMADEAELLLLDAGQKWPGDKLIAIHLAEIAVHKRDWPAALTRWRVLREHFEETPRAYQGECDALIELGRFDEAEAVLTRILERYTNHPVLQMRSAMVAMRRQDWQVACQRWEDYRQRFSSTVETYEQEALALTRSGQMEKAEELLILASKRFPNQRKIALQLAQISVQRQDWQQAATRWKILRQRFKPTTEDFKSESWAHAQLGDFEKAESILELARKRWPRNKILALQWAEYAMMREDWSTASTRWLGLCKKFPNLSKPYSRGVDALIRQQAFEPAEALLREAMDRFPEKQDIINRMKEIDQAREENTSLGEWRSFYHQLLRPDASSPASASMPLSSSGDIDPADKGQTDELAQKRLQKPFWKRLFR